MSRIGIRVLIVVLWAALAAGAAEAGFRLERELRLEAGGEFLLDADSGSIRVVGGGGPGVRVLITSSRDDIEERYDFSFQEESGRAVVRARKRGSFARRWFGWGANLHFEVEVPSRVDVELDTSGGSIEVEGIDGRVHADTSGGAISASRITGDVRLDTSGGSIRAEGIGGHLEADTSGGSIRVDGVGGDVVADTSGGSVTVRDAGGRVEASSSGGPVTAYFAAGNRAGGSLSTSGGRVTAYVDPAVDLDVDLSTSGGRASVDLPLTIRGGVTRSSLRGQLNGGGALLKLRSSGGSVAVKSL